MTNTANTLEKLLKTYTKSNAILAFATISKSTFYGLTEERITMLFDTQGTRTSVCFSFHTTPSGRLKKGFRVWLDVNHWNEFDHIKGCYTGKTEYNHQNLDDDSENKAIIKAVRDLVIGLQVQKYSTRDVIFLQADQAKLNNIAA